MDKLIQDTCEKIDSWIESHKNPVIFWSGGKDSTAMLHLTLFKVGCTLPVVQFREPRFRSRYAHSDLLADRWDLEVYDYAPISHSLADGMDIDTGEPRFDFVKHYQVAPADSRYPTGKIMSLCLGTEHPSADEVSSDRFLCGKDALDRPTGTFNFPWDLIFHGQKSCDVDLIKGEVPLAQDLLVQANAPTQAYPMRFWSDQEIWQYLESENVPNDHTRYAKIDGAWSHKKDKTSNSDYYPICLNCVNRHLGPVVDCPKHKCTTSNVSHTAPYIDLQSQAQGFRPTWSNSIVNNVGHAALTNGAGLFSDQTDPMPQKYRPK